MSPARRLRLFLDSNVLTGGMVAPWGLDKAMLSLCAANICRLVLAEAVLEEVEYNLEVHSRRLPQSEGENLLGQFRRLVQLARPEMIPFPDSTAVRTNRHLIRHESDVPVLLSAIAARPDWLLTHNTRHFTPAVALRTGIRIATPAEFFRSLSLLLR